MQNWLRKQVISADLDRTLQSTSVPRGRANFESGGRLEKLTLARGADVPGGALNNQPAWRKEINRADVLVYLFDAYGVTSDAPQQRRYIVRDCSIIGQWLADRPERKRPLVALVGTHCDLIEGFDRQRLNDTLVRIYDELMQLQAIQDACWNVQDALEEQDPPALIVGSLFDAPLADDLSRRVFKQHFEL
jgi:hypothetical protein